jgi:hypothetical protein
MYSFTYDIFVETMKNLSPNDVISACQVNRELRNFCKRPEFWSQLIYFNLGVKRPNATAKDYKFLFDIYHIIPKKAYSHTLIQLQTETNEEFKSRKIELQNQFDEDYLKVLRFVDYLRDKEIQGYYKGLPLSYFKVNPNYILITMYNKKTPSLKTSFFTSYTVEGAMLKFENYYTKFLNDYEATLSRTLGWQRIMSPQYGEFEIFKQGVEDFNEYTDVTLEKPCMDYLLNALVNE